jgi:hypothetical protein
VGGHGCVEWYQHGLGTSAAVEAATAAYRAETDIVDRFFGDVCVFGPKQKIGKKELFEAWEQWCYENGEEPGKQNSFTRLMGDKGVVLNFEEVKVKGNRIWKGIDVGESAPQTPSDEKVPPYKSPAKTGVVLPLGGTFPKIRQKYLRMPLVRKGFRKTAKKCPPGPKVPPKS